MVLLVRQLHLPERTIPQAQEEADKDRVKQIQDAAVSAYYAHRAADGGWASMDASMLPASEAVAVAHADAPSPA